MSALTRFLYPVAAPRSIDPIVAWWERRRLAYNAIVGGVGIVTLSIVSFLGVIPPSPRWPVVPLLPVLVYGVMANVCYTLGWVVEGAAHVVWGRELRPSGPIFFRQGLLFSIGLSLLPIAVGVLDWGFRILRFFW